jgi:SAM-dependent methyltransferase
VNDTNRNRVRQLAAIYLQEDDPTGWFEELYFSAQGNEAAIPWADLTVNPNLASWLDENKIQGNGKTALVVGCGLGDDAEALANIGFAVTAFDIAPTAIAWCQQRFPQSHVNYIVEDLLNPNLLIDRQFDFILESYTLQALPAKIRQRAIEQIARSIAPLGKLLVICRGRGVNQPEGELPWPLTKEELNYFVDLGLQQVKFEDYLDISVRRFRVEYRSLLA